MTAPVQDAIVLFGDSITQMGWMEGGLCQKLAGAFEIFMFVVPFRCVLSVSVLYWYAIYCTLSLYT